MKVEAIMTRSVLFCQAHQPLRQVWENLNERSLRCVPLLDRDHRPPGVLRARDIAGPLLEEALSEESVLRADVLGIGYQ